MPLNTDNLSSDRIESIDLLRGYAAVVVCLYHLSYQGALFEVAWIKQLFAHGEIGVPIFFAITGFVIPYSLFRGQYTFRKFGVFFAKRLIRLEPPYILSILLAIALWLTFGFHVGEPLSLTPLNLSLHIGYLVGWASSLGYNVAWYIPVYWTLQFEFQFYLLAALFFPVLGSNQRAVRMSFFAAFLGLQATIGESHGVAATPIVYRFADLFLLGIVTFQRRVEISDGKEFLFLAAVATISIATTHIAFLIYGPLICFLILGTNFKSRVWRSLGDMSYSLYLLHTVLGLWLTGALVTVGRISPLWAFIVSFIATILAAFIVSKLVEQPAMRAAKRLRYR